MSIASLICRIFGHKIQSTNASADAQVFRLDSEYSEVIPFEVHLVTCSRCKKILGGTPMGPSDGGEKQKVFTP